MKTWLAATALFGELTTGEIVMIAMLAVVFFFSRHLFVNAELRRANWDKFLLFLAQGFGAGRLRPGPGTWGSLVGLGWFALLLSEGDLVAYLVVALVTAVAAVGICGAAERILDERDPGSVVLDEIVAVPLCFLGWLAAHWERTGRLPAVEILFTGPGALRVLIVFVLFRAFDILKPWPISASQRLSGGWGVVTDDVLAAATVALVTLPFFR